MSLAISGITWILSYRCNLNCAHCFFDVQGDLRLLDHELAREALASLEQVEPLAWQHVSGGEPLLFEAELHRLLEVIQEHGSKTVGIATNGFWGDSEQRAEQGPIGLYRLAVTKGWQPEKNFADECALCWQSRYFLRKSLFERLGSEILGPDECYPEEGSGQKNGVSSGGERTPL